MISTSGTSWNQLPLLPGCRPAALELLDQVGERLLLARRARRAAFEFVERQRAGHFLHRRFGDLRRATAGATGAEASSGAVAQAASGEGGGKGAGQSRAWRESPRSGSQCPPLAKARARRNLGWQALRSLAGRCSCNVMHGDWQDAIERARAHSPFLELRACDASPSWPRCSNAGDGEAALALRRERRANGAPDVAVALRRERLALALALAIGDLAGAFPLGAGHGRTAAPSPTARSMPRSPTRSAAACPMPSRPASPRSRSASTARASSTTAPTSTRSCSTIPHACRAASATSRARRRSAMPAALVETLSRADRRGLCLPGRLAAAPGLRSQPAGDLVRRGADAITKARRWPGSAPPSSARAPRRAMSRRASSSSPRSARSSGAAASISPRSRRSAA